MKGKLWWTFEDANDLFRWVIDKEIIIKRIWQLPEDTRLQVEFEVEKERADEILGLAQPIDEEEWIE